MCSWYGGPFNDGNCRRCTNPQTYSCDLCGNDSHYGYDCPPRVPLVYEQESCYNQNFGDNYYPSNPLSFPQQYLCCKNCWGPHANFQCQPRNKNSYDPNLCYNYKFSGFDQPPQYSIDHQEDLNQQTMNDVHNKFDDIIESKNELIKTLQSLGEMLSQREQAANLSNLTLEPSRRFICYDDDDYEKRLSHHGDENLRTIPEKESNEFIKSSVEDLVPIPSESEDTSGSDSECDLPVCDDFFPINVHEGKSVTFSNPLFDSNNDFTFSDDESLSDEDVPEDNVKIYSNPLFEFDDKYISSDVNRLFDEVLEDIESKASYDSNIDELTLLVTPIFDSNKDECFDPGGDVDEINASLDFEDGYYDSEGDVLYLEILLSDDTTPYLPPEVFLDHDPRSLSDINDLKIMVKVFDPEILKKSFSPTYVSLPFKDRLYLFLTYVI
nr:hypothetical protein [Tanacetum cinerariifolium]